MESKSPEAQSGFAQPPPGAGRIAILDPLRGLAAFAVMWFHLTWLNPLFDGAEGAAAWIRASGTGGWLGVEVFFVISGFVLPYAMWRGRYRIRDFGRFLWKRLLRLEPPYLVAIAVTLGLWLSASLTPWSGADPFVIDWKHLLLHFAYLNAFFELGWYNSVFWTLAVEFQFYIVIALLFPLVVHPRLAVRLLLPVGLASVALLSSNTALVFHYLALFGLGIATAQRYVGLISDRSFAWLFAIMSVIAFLTLTLPQAIVGVATAGFIAAFARADARSAVGRLAGWRPLVWLGMMSYSLYLIHLPVGGRVASIGSNFVTGLAGQLVVLAMALAVCLITSWIMYKLVEVPSQRMSSRLQYRGSGRERRMRSWKSRQVLEGSAA